MPINIKSVKCIDLFLFCAILSQLKRTNIKPNNLFLNKHIKQHNNTTPKVTYFTHIQYSEITELFDLIKICVSAE